MSDHENPFEMVESRCQSEAISRVTSGYSDDELISLVAKLHSQQITILGARTADRLRRIDVNAVVEQGCLLHLVRLASTKPSHELVFENVFADAGVCRTQGYRALAVWRRMGRVLLQEPQLQQFFVPEALKLLAAESSPEAAREEALERAREREVIHSKDAESLIRKHTPQLASTKRSRKFSQPSKSTALFRKWTFSGTVVRVELKPTQPLDRKDLQIVISDLQAALVELQTLADHTFLEEMTVE